MAQTVFKAPNLLIGTLSILSAYALGCGTAPYQAPGNDTFVVIAPPADPSAKALSNVFADDEGESLGPDTPTPPSPPAPPATPPAGSVADGGACSNGVDCASGTCEGEGCGPAGGTCAPLSRMCTRDLRTYCGCDNQEFKASGTCPGRRYSQRGRCGS